MWEGRRKKARKVFVEYADSYSNDLLAHVCDRVERMRKYILLPSFTVRSSDGL